MQYLKNLGIPVLFMLGYLFMGLILHMFVDSVIVITTVADVIIGVVGLFYCNVCLFSVSKKSLLKAIIYIIAVVYVVTYDMNKIELKVLQEMFLVLLVAPCAEEILIRGICFNHLKKILHIGIAYIASALIFAMLHVNLVMLPFYIMFGIITAMIFEHTGRLENCIVVHSLYNLIVLIF